MVRHQCNQEATRVRVEVLKKVGIAVLWVETNGDADYAFQMSLLDLERLRQDIAGMLPPARQPDRE